MSNEAKALEGIRKASGTERGEYSIDEFVSHHIDELPGTYWEKHLSTEIPSSEQVIGLLVLRSKWENEEVYDFTLPDDVTDYVVSVSFDEDGKIEDIEMES
ncbi:MULTISPECIES: DUF2004 domain-containing protein [Marinobacter]|jgi:hypothetical protein|uniref:DUF2004 domain-containing protein n=1 Tax=Marinobacter salarius TaxID=1420917 RepID=A0A1W6KB04_9GAMM|nr:MULTISPECIES: DUF2004 domain-containing protein [Marinobacter]ARM84618.1 hypothetical protein MARSALSMR5_02557 [Marinobacter salarius]AZR39504.1 hypothetical protein MTMN5_00021 [Marinobacter salarius]MDM8181782.1 DUF2004 domain-containing protein [Marinobacter salarius]RUT74417.1 DUF2004 domain-containing protein [Marinobacter sp. NP-6]